MRVGKSLVLLSLAVLSWADSKKVTKQTIHWHEMRRTEFVQGEKRRDEWDDGMNHAAIISMPGSTYQLDLKRQEYVEQTWPIASRNAQLGALQALAKQVRQPDPRNVIDVYFETVDTGERKEFFGKTASHLILRRRDVPRSKECGGVEMKDERDGWYMSQQRQAGMPRYLLMAGLSSSGCGLPFQVFHGSPTELLLIPMVETHFGVKTEVVEFSETPLDVSIFAVPADFKRVAQLQQPETPWQEQLWNQSNMLLRRVQSLF